MKKKKPVSQEFPISRRVPQLLNATIEKFAAAAVHSAKIDFAVSDKMSANNEKDNSYDLVRAISQRERYDILNALNQASLNISDLARKTNMDRATVAYHLGVLENVGIVESKYEMLKQPASKGKIGRYYFINPKRLNEALEFQKLLMQKLHSKVNPKDPKTATKPYP